MNSIFTRLATLALLVAGVTSQFMINTPQGVVVCQPTQFTWSSGGNPPFFLSIEPAADPTGQALEQFSGLTGTSMTWVANLSVGTSCSLRLVDSQGNAFQSGTFEILSGPDTSCLNGGASSGGSSGSSTTGGSIPTTGNTGTAGATSATSPATTTGASTTGAATTVQRTSSTGTSTGTSSTARSSSTNAAAAPTNFIAQAGAAVVGAAVLAVLA